MAASGQVFSKKKNRFPGRASRDSGRSDYTQQSTVPPSPRIFRLSDGPGYNVRFRFFLMGIFAINNFITMTVSMSMSIVK